MFYPATWLPMYSINFLCVIYCCRCYMYMYSSDNIIGLWNKYLYIPFPSMQHAVHTTEVDRRIRRLVCSNVVWLWNITCGYEILSSTKFNITPQYTHQVRIVGQQKGQLFLFEKLCCGFIKSSDKTLYCMQIAHRGYNFDFLVSSLLQKLRENRICTMFRRNLQSFTESYSSRVQSCSANVKITKVICIIGYRWYYYRSDRKE